MTCDRCAAEATTSLAAARLCASCKEGILAPIRARVAERDGPHYLPATETGGGIGRQVGPLAVEYGPGWADLRCDQCGATWTGRINTACPWCDDRIKWQWEEQRQLVLTLPDVDPDDRTYDAVMGAWLDRIAVAVEAQIIDREEARRAWDRGQRRGHAA